jgi:predicted house-cleaning noncanonical NTP pyrophosphatase (MazG superfamily)
MSTTSRTYYNKLVRDHIPDKIKTKGEHCEVRPATDVQEFQQELMKKIKEEAASLSTARTKEEFLSEYADLIVVLQTLIEQLGITSEELEVAREENLRKKGGYKHRHFLVWSEDCGYTSNESVQGISR